MDKNRAVELLNRALGCMQADPKDCVSKKCSLCKHNATKEDGIEAISMAIKALEQAPTFDWLMQKADEWGMTYGKQFLIEAQRAWKGEQHDLMD